VAFSFCTFLVHFLLFLWYKSEAKGGERKNEIVFFFFNTSHRLNQEFHSPFDCFVYSGVSKSKLSEEQPMVFIQFAVLEKNCTHCQLPYHLLPQY
jgi:hypothetical protein